MGLKETIKKAFADVPYPGDNNITRCPYHCAECRRVAEFFKGKDWNGQPAEELRGNHVALSLFTPEAFHYFLPGYMLVSLDTYEKGDVIPDAIRFHFEYVHETRNHFAVRLSKFTVEQRKAIIDYLIHMERKGAGSSEHAIGMLSEESAYA
jgi:rubrerythrin